jgi:exodeoxyribonuclease VII large subunit
MADRDVYTVSRLNREVQQLLQQGFGVLWVEAEISNFSRPASGHWYFSLKDRDAQVRCAMFRQRNTAVRFKPAEGMQVLARARVGLYEPRGDFQLIVEHLEEAGVGALQRAFEQLRDRLAAEGLFAPDLKRPLPAVPRAIGVITSPSGAAIRDILHVLAARFPAAPVVIYPSAVQGAAAAPELRAALRTAIRRAECDVLILARGGGSLEDLWAFNDEALARAIRASPIPVVTGIGHEVDFTIADFVADARAPTPTAAAQAVTPDRRQLQAAVAQGFTRLRRALRRELDAAALRAQHLAQRLQRAHPGQRLNQHLQRLDELQQRLTLALNARHTAAAHRYELARQRLPQAMTRRLEQIAQRLALASRGLQAVSPLATLARGFAVATGADGRVLTDARLVAIDDPIGVRLAHGQLQARITRTDPDDTR